MQKYVVFSRLVFLSTYHSYILLRNPFAFSRALRSRILEIKKLNNFRAFLNYGINKASRPGQDTVHSTCNLFTEIGLPDGPLDHGELKRGAHAEEDGEEPVHAKPPLARNCIEDLTQHVVPAAVPHCAKFDVKAAC